jgi:hypothetical protein
MPRRLPHDLDNPRDVFTRDLGMEQIAHRVDENHRRLSQFQRLSKTARTDLNVEASFIGMANDTAEALRESPGIAV